MYEHSELMLFIRPRTQTAALTLTTGTSHILHPGPTKFPSHFITASRLC